MKRKKILFGLIEMNTFLYNILYALVCVCVLILVLILSYVAVITLVGRNKIPDYINAYKVLVWAMIAFIGGIMTNKKHFS